MKQCAMCPNEADLFWDPPELGSLTPAGAALVEEIEELIPEKPRCFLCASCYRERANVLGDAAVKEQARRKTPS